MPLTDKVVDIQEMRNTKITEELRKAWAQIAPEQKQRMKEIGEKIFKTKETEE